MAELGNDIFFATIPELNARLVAKEISAEELARAFATRLEQLGPRYNALALPLPQQALRRAKAVDAEIKRGRLRGPAARHSLRRERPARYRGTAHHLGREALRRPGLRLQRHRHRQARCVGAVLTGKLSMVELAGGGGYRAASASLFGPGLNPWDRTRGRADPPAARRRRSPRV